MFSKLLFKLNLITESEYQADILNSINDSDDDDISVLDGIFIIMFLTMLFTLGVAWMNLL